MEGTYFSLIPPLVAIVLCVVLREAILSLFVGIFVGALFLYGFSPATAFLRAVDDIILASFIDSDHAITIFFTVLTGGLTEILNRSPNARHVIHHLVSKIKNRWKASVLIWFSGLFFFVDDYANCLIVGNAYRKLVDGLKISREKLAYLVDTTSAPIASLALVSTWIGIEITVIDKALAAEGVTDFQAYGLFLSSIPYRFYPVLAMILCLMVCTTGRDFGPMLKAERRAIRSKPKEDDSDRYSVEEKPSLKSYFSFIPLACLLVSAVTFLGVNGYHNGAGVDWAHPWQTVVALFGAADPYRSLLWATMLSTAVAFFIHLGILREGFKELNANWMSGLRMMFTICLILTLAWSIGDVCDRMKTGAYVASLLGENFNPDLLPFMTFLFAAAISFATGTSYGTMSILMPIALPLAINLGMADPEIMCGTVGSVLGGAIFGDHCSPLSDTTILSSGASGCPVTAHVNTQLPYAVVVALISTLCLFLVPIKGFSAMLLLVTASLILFGLLRLFGKKAADDLGDISQTETGNPATLD